MDFSRDQWTTTRLLTRPLRGRRAQITPLAEATVVLMPVCDAIRTAGPTPAHEEEENDALAGWTVKCGRFMVMAVASLVLVALGTLIGVIVMFVNQDDPVTTSTSSTTLMTSTISTAILTSTTSTAITTSASSTSSTTTPEMKTVSEKSTDFIVVVFFRRGSTSHAFIFLYYHLPSSPSPPLCPQVGSNWTWRSSEMLSMTDWESSVCKQLYRIRSSIPHG